MRFKFSFGKNKKMRCESMRIFVTHSNIKSNRNALTIPIPVLKIKLDEIDWNDFRIRAVSQVLMGMIFVIGGTWIFGVTLTLALYHF